MSFCDELQVVRAKFSTGSVPDKDVANYFWEIGDIVQLSIHELEGITEIVIKYKYPIQFEYATQKRIVSVNGVDVRVSKDDGEIEEIDEEEERREEEEELALYAKHIEALHSRPVADLLASGSSTIFAPLDRKISLNTAALDSAVSLDTPKTVGSSASTTTTAPSANYVPRSRKRSNIDSAASGDAPISPEDYGYKLKRHDDADDQDVHQDLDDDKWWLLPPIER